MLTQKLIRQFLICLYKRHIQKHGESIGQLYFTRFNIMDDTLLEDIPDLVQFQEDGSFKRLTMVLVRELKERGYATGQNMEFALTTEGYFEAQRLLSPYKHFAIEHWKWLVSAFFTLITILLAIVRLTECQ